MPTETNSNVSELFLTPKEIAKADTNHTGVITPQKLVNFVCEKANISLEDPIPSKQIDMLARRFVTTVRNQLNDPLVGSAVNSFVVMELNREALDPATPPEIARKLQHVAAAIHKFLVDLDTALVEGDTENAMIALDALNRFEGAMDGKLPVRINVELFEKATPVHSQSTNKFANAVAVAQGT